jgi:cell division protein FtsB
MEMSKSQPGVGILLILLLKTHPWHIRVSLHQQSKRTQQELKHQQQPVQEAAAAEAASARARKDRRAQPPKP